MAARVTAYLVALIVGLTFIAGLLVGAQREDAGPVDLIVVNGHVFTGNASGAGAEAVAVQGNRILRVGSNRDIQRLRRPQTVVVDANGGSVLPGLNDRRLARAGLARQGLELDTLGSAAAIEAAIATWAAAHPDDPWVTGAGWTPELFPAGQPTRQMLDALVPDRPALLLARDGETAWANSPALALADITRRTPSPEDGEIIKTSRRGEPTGVLRGTAVALVAAHVPARSRTEKLTSITHTAREAHRRGVTSVQHSGTTVEDLELYDELRQRDALPLRIYAVFDGPVLAESPIDEWERLRKIYGDDPGFKTGAIRVVIEADDAVSDNALVNVVGELDRRGWQIILQPEDQDATDRAVRALALVAERSASPLRERRHRLELLHDGRDTDDTRLAALGVSVVRGAQDRPDVPVATSNTPEVPSGPSAEGIAHADALSGARAEAAWPVLSLPPLVALQLARPKGAEAAVGVATTTRSGRRPELAQVVSAYTREAAWASFDEHRKGALERDMLADIVILNRNIFAPENREAADIDIVTTIFDGQVVYRRSDGAER